MNYFSFSQLRCYEECPRKYYFQYVLKRFEKKNLAMVFGSAIHSALETYYKGGTPEQAEERFISEFTKNSVGIKLKNGENLERGGKIGVKMLNEYFKPENKPYFDKPKYVEYKFQTILKHPITQKELDVPIKGVIDLITNDGFIVDHKTSASMWTLEMVEEDLQKVFYWLAFYSIFGVEPQGFIFNFLIKRVNEPKFDNQAVEVNKSQMLYCIDYVKFITDEIKKERFPRNIGKQCRYCPNRLLCLP